MEGKVSIRVINADGPSLQGDGPALILRVNLTWRTSAGDDHRSHAFYAIPAKNAALLEQQTPPDMSELEALTPDADPQQANAALSRVQIPQAAINVLYGAEWSEKFPGSFGQMLNEADDDSGAVRLTLDKEFEERYLLAAQYHAAAVDAVRETGPEAACLLSGTELGDAASPDEIVKVHEWLREQPEAATAAA